MQRLAKPALIVALCIAWAGWATLAQAQTRTITDSAGRRVEIPLRVTKVLAAGPPASILLYTLAPEKMVGWVRTPSPAEESSRCPVHDRRSRNGFEGGVHRTDTVGRPIPAGPLVASDVGLPQDTDGSASATNLSGPRRMFTCVTACLLAGPPKRSFTSKASTASLPPPPLRLLPAGANQLPGGSCTR